MTMKRIYIIVCLFILVLNSFGQTEIDRDIVNAEQELNVRDTTILDLIIEHAPSGTARAAGSGMSLDGNNMDLGGTLDTDADILGAANSMSLGTSGSKLNVFQVNTSGNVIYNSDANIIFNPSGTLWTLNGAHWISAGGDTLATNAVVQDLIAASEAVLPYNWEYTFNSSIVDARPGIGLFRLNNATLANVTQIYIDYFDADGVAKNDFLAMADTGSAVAIQTDVNNYALYKLTGGYNDAGNYYKYNVTYQSHNGTISGLNTIDLDISNSTGSGGGLADSVAQTYAADTFYVGIDAKHIIYNDTDALVLVDSSDNSVIMLGEEVVINNNTSIIALGDEKIRLSSGANVTIIDGDTTFADGTNGSTANNSKWKTISVRDSLELPDGTWLLGADTSGNVTADTGIFNVVVVGGSEPIDTAWDSKYVMENTIINELNFEEITFTDHSKGRLYLDSATQGLILDDDISGKWNLSAEVADRFYNPTGLQINNGQVVRLSGSHIATNGYIYGAVSLAGNGSFDSTDVIGIATTNIQSLGYGRVVFLGRINNINTIGLSGTVYLGHSGALRNDPPLPPLVTVVIGSVTYIDAINGVLAFNPREPRYDPTPIFSASFEDAAEIIENNGVGIYSPITNVTNDLYTERRNIGFIFQGDSVSPLQPGDYVISYSYSQSGQASQTDIYETATFIDGVREYFMPRTISGTNLGGIPFAIDKFMVPGQWISFKTANKTTGTRTCTFENAIINIEFSR